MAAPRLSRDAYFCRPSVERLRECSETERAAVHNFQVGRRGFGSIVWKGFTDVRDLDLDQLVDIGRRYVSVGEGCEEQYARKLSKPATLVLDMHSESSIRGEGSAYLEEILREECRLQLASFLNYDEDLDVLTVGVDHFSRYGFLDESDDEHTPSAVGPLGPEGTSNQQRDAEVSDLKGATVEKVGTTTPSRILSVPDDWSDAGDEQSSPAENEDDIQKTEDSEAADETKASVFDSLEIPRLHRMQRLLFPHKGEEIAPVSDSEMLVEESLVSADAVDEQGRRVRPRHLESPRMKGRIKSSTFSVSVLRNAIQQTQMAPTLLDTLHPVPSIQDSVASGAEGSTRDPMLRLGRSFRCAFGGNGNLCTPVLPQRAGESFGIRIVRISKQHPKEFYGEALQTHMKEWERDEYDSMGTGKLSQPTLENIFAVAPTARDTSLQVLVEHFERYQQKHLAIIFGLLLALYGEYDGAQDHIIRFRISRWLEEHACSWAKDEHSAGNYYQDVYSTLSSGKVDEAAQSLLEKGDYRLALLVSRSMEFPGSSFHRDVDEFANRFTVGDAGEKTREDVLDLLHLLSGNIEKSRQLKEVSWYRAFALFLWYSKSGRKDIGSLANAVEAFTTAWDSSRIAGPPVPPHASDLNLDERYAVAKNGETDSAYEILCLFSNIAHEHGLERAISTTSFGSEKAILDFTGSWMLYQWLRGIVGAGARLRQELRVHATFAEQLEGNSMPLWSVYVMASAQTSAFRDWELRSLIWRLWPKIVKDTAEVRGREEALEPEAFLCGVLKVPYDWILEAKVLWARYRQAHAEEAELLCKLGADWNEMEASSDAHDLICDKIAPKIASMAVRSLRGWETAAKRLINLLSTLSASSLPDWNVKGGVLLTFLKLLADDEAEKCKAWNDPAVLHSFMTGVSRFSSDESEEQTFLKLVMANFGASLQRRLLLKKNIEEGEESGANLAEIARGDLITVCLSPSHGLQLAGEYAGDDALGTYDNLFWSVPLGSGFGVPVGL
ncbi:hypothetical protein NDN08_004394 [Rhodosorus marinus]|uniref:Peptidase S59 domain-containing protein n=1 Tax=Rhodosorus marinus TaxID=101924 RepID=A0AAV8UL56_9RHOD|nr:hypothetical protein NDN08_004394 [Rhodosorus marinus]